MKRVDKSDLYTYKGTEYLLVNTVDGWIYRFKRPESEDDEHPFEFEKKQRPDGSWSTRDSRLPDKVVEYVSSTYDASNLHARPSSLRSNE